MGSRPPLPKRLKIQNGETISFNVLMAQRVNYYRVPSDTHETRNERY